MSDINLPIEIRTFVTPEEVRALPGFSEDNPIRPDNYAGVAGDYHFKDEEFRCCAQDDTGALCREGHGWGFAIRLKDKTHAVLGSLCARTKYDAHDTFKRDIALYINLKARLERQARLAELLRTKEARIGELAAIRLQVLDLRARMDAFKAELGSSTALRLERMRSPATVRAKAVSEREYVQDGKTKVERSSVPIELGTIPGIEALRPGAGDDILTAISVVLQAFARAESIKEDVRTAELERLNVEISSADSIVDRINRLLDTESSFRKSDLFLLCFLDGNSGERYAAARVAMREAGQPPSRDGAKNWLAAKEAQLKARYGANSIELDLA